MKYFVILLTVAVVGVTAFTVSKTKQEEGFKLSGKVEVAERLINTAQANNTSCSIIVKNEADVPIAIKRILNPSFPLDFNFTKNDLLIDSFNGNIKLEVQINSHGKLGVLKSGDVFGESNQIYTSGQQDILLVADKMMGTPSLGNKRVKGNFFRTAAR